MKERYTWPIVKAILIVLAMILSFGCWRLIVWMYGYNQFSVGFMFTLQAAMFTSLINDPPKRGRE